MLKLRITAAVVTTAALMAYSSPAAAQEPPTVSSGGYGAVDVVVVDRGAPGGSTAEVRPAAASDGGDRASAGGGGQSCDYRATPTLDGSGPAATDVYLALCEDGSASYVTTGGPAGGTAAAPPQVTSGELALRAFERLKLPDPAVGLSPDPATHPYQLVNLPIWYWVTNWAPLRERTQAGSVWAEVTAEPVVLAFNGGDGGGSSCERPGVAWRPGMLEDLPMACRYTYKRASERYTATVTLTWRVSWVGSGGSGGTLEPLATSVTQPLTVYERQAVVTYGRG